jgi:hypothetical protein
MYDAPEGDGDSDGEGDGHGMTRQVTLKKFVDINRSHTRPLSPPQFYGNKLERNSAAMSPLSSTFVEKKGKPPPTEDALSMEFLSYKKDDESS